MCKCYGWLLFVEHGVQGTKPYFRAARATLEYFKTGSTCIKPHDRPIRQTTLFQWRDKAQKSADKPSGCSELVAAKPVSRILRCSRSSVSQLWLKFQQTGKSFSAISFTPSLLCVFFVLITFLCHIRPLPPLLPHRLTQRIVSISGHVKDRPRAPRSRMTTRAQDNRLRTQHRDRYRPATRTSATAIGNHSRPISAQTVINRLRAHEIRPRRP